jgi:tetratricopeptide (TPR) repeat protein
MSFDARAHQQIQDQISRKEYDLAETALRARLKETPENADAYYLLGVMHYFRGHIKQTVFNLREALKHDPRHTDAAICLSVLFNDIGRYDEAKGVFDQANQSVSVKKNGDDAEVDRKFAVKHLELADLYFRYRRYDEAVEEYSKAASLDPFTLEIRIRLAKSYAKKGFLTRAIQELQQLKVEHPRYTPARLQLGLLHYSQNNVLDAELEWESVMDLDSGNREAPAYLEMAKQARTNPSSHLSR